MTLALAVIEPRFLTIDEILTLHETAIAQYGGSLGLRDRAALESALAQPRQVFNDQFAHAFPFEMAAVYAFHICKNHTFVDGNKRTAFAAAVAFLRLNDFNLEADENDAAEMMLAVANNEMDKEAISRWLAKRSRKRPSMELRDFFRKLQFMELTETAKSIQPNHGTRLAEGFASINEAISAMPILTEIEMWHKSLPAVEQEQSFIPIAQTYRTFLALYRIAEDMGYEW